MSYFGANFSCGMKQVCNDVLVRRIEPIDEEDYFEIFSNPEVARFDDFKPIDRVDLAVDMARIATYTHSSAFCEYAVAIQPSNKMIGVITLDKKRKYAYLGYHFNPAYHGRGLSYLSVSLFINGLSNEMKSKLRLVSHPSNKPSISLALKLGFTFVKKRARKGILEVVYRFVEGHIA